MAAVEKKCRSGKISPWEMVMLWTKVVVVEMEQNRYI